MEIEENLPPDVKQLERRQEFILRRLEALRLEVDKMTQDQQSTASTVVPAKSAQPKVQQNVQSPNGILQDLVISSSPANPPLSLLVLGEQLSEQCKVLKSSYVHSTVKEMSNQLKSAFCKNRTLVNRSDYHLALTLIWKDEKCKTSLMISPNIQTPIHGEANVARFLSRMLNPAYDSFDIISATEIDGWLDLSTQLLYGNNKERAAVLRTLNASLGKNSWIVGSHLSLADIVVWSALQQNKMTQAVPSNVKKWLEACNSLDIFQGALEAAAAL